MMGGNVRSAIAFTSGRVRVMDGYGLPVSFKTAFEEVGQPSFRLDLEVSEDGRVECKRFELSASEACPEITPRHLQTVSLSDRRDRAIQIAAKRVADRQGGHIVLSIGGHPSDRRAAVHAANKRRNRMTPEALRRVAEIAQVHPKGQGARSDALVSDGAYRAIEDALDVSPRTAQRWVKRALEAGLL
jgi:hypothetical protein